MRHSFLNQTRNECHSSSVFRFAFFLFERVSFVPNAIRLQKYFA